MQLNAGLHFFRLVTYKTFFCNYNNVFWVSRIPVWGDCYCHEEGPLSRRAGRGWPLTIMDSAHITEGFTIIAGTQQDPLTRPWKVRLRLACWWVSRKTRSAMHIIHNAVINISIRGTIRDPSKHKISKFQCNLKVSLWTLKYTHIQNTLLALHYNAYLYVACNPKKAPKQSTVLYYGEIWIVAMKMRHEVASSRI